ncbi:MAG: histidine kinase [Novosphingopyxis baekryungensis]|jgi:two-component system LytT family sensor kinase|uniref:sensor histidine kinase n=1 Tax=Novosphingopyxis baekryungensis TaxID=279369 RepID=UPI0004031961|nr:histidine kinase [Novosphingopyxis baekryungensis]MDE0933418.1 histidine kinase [Novosphingopyxis baekryungensis]
MAIVELSIEPFFSNKNRAFWNLHSAGWAGALIFRAGTAIANQVSLDKLVPLLISTITGYSISLILSVVYRIVFDRRPLVIWSGVLASLTVAIMVYAFMDAWVFQLTAVTERGFTSILAGSLLLPGMTLSAWSALYFAINFYVRAEEQADQLFRLEAQATSAQLTMLRYQLNPHFLFNTLNSISTLVLLKQTEPANAMLSRLSSFLRFTLVNEASARVTVAKEIETLKLYLDIEKMRFEERLRPDFDIEDAACDALIPSLLLQPLVENAIKYAVTPKEEGADIHVRAQRIGDHVRISVIDTGPGLQMAKPDKAMTSTGVGMANTRERLMQAYGTNHRFDISSPPGGGFEVIVEIPYELPVAPGSETGLTAGGTPESRGMINA